MHLTHQRPQEVGHCAVRDGPTRQWNGVPERHDRIVWQLCHQLADQPGFAHAGLPRDERNLGLARDGPVKGVKQRQQLVVASHHHRAPSGHAPNSDPDHHEVSSSFSASGHPSGGDLTSSLRRHRRRSGPQRCIGPPSLPASRTGSSSTESADTGAPRSAQTRSPLGYAHAQDATVRPALAAFAQFDSGCVWPVLRRGWLFRCWWVRAVESGWRWLVRWWAWRRAGLRARRVRRWPAAFRGLRRLASCLRCR